MPEEDLPPQHSRLRVEEDLPPQSRSVMMYAAGGGFLGALLAILVAKLLAGPCCCAQPAPQSVGALATSELILPG